jgi:hypothetical protein
VVVLPLTPATRGLLDAAALAAMRPGAWLLNIGRGAVVDEAALIGALRERRIAGAILDVLSRSSRCPPTIRLWGMDNVVITPHIAGPSTAEEIAPVFNDNLAPGSPARISTTWWTASGGTRRGASIRTAAACSRPLLASAVPDVMSSWPSRSVRAAAGPLPRRSSAPPRPRS